MKKSEQNKKYLVIAEECGDGVNVIINERTSAEELQAIAESLIEHARMKESGSMLYH
ncbi:MAG: hypothetical protein WAO12_11540 [Venatoribacter sp.]